VAEFNIYCDESCHLEHDHQRVMVLGAVACPVEKTREIAARIRELKVQHHLPAEFEIKWSKVSNGRLDFYLSVLDYFFDDDDLSFRALVVPDKSVLDHERFGQTHDDFYYKMYFDMLKVLLDPACRYNVYLDIKDTRSNAKTQHLHEVLANNAYDFQRQIVQRIDLVRSEHVQQVQLADLLIGGLSYLHRGLSSNRAKSGLVARMQERSRYSLRKSTLLRERKVNLFVWRPREAAGNG
jgi:hypothetical protein